MVLQLKKERERTTPGISYLNLGISKTKNPGRQRVKKQNKTAYYKATKIRIISDFSYGVFSEKIFSKETFKIFIETRFLKYFDNGNVFEQYF